MSSNSDYKIDIVNLGSSILAAITSMMITTKLYCSLISILFGNLKPYPESDALDWIFMGMVGPFWVTLGWLLFTICPWISFFLFAVGGVDGTGSNTTVTENEEV